MTLSTVVKEWSGTAARLLLAAVLGYAGLAKLQDLTAAGHSVAVYQIVPDSAAAPIGQLLPFVEVAAALLLALGLATRTTAVLAGTLLTVYIGAIVSVWARGLSIDCGCFGGGGALSGGAQRGYAVDIARDVLFLGAALLLVRRPRTHWALDRWVLDVKEEQRT